MLPHVVQSTVLHYALNMLQSVLLHRGGTKRCTVCAVMLCPNILLNFPYTLSGLRVFPWTTTKSKLTVQHVWWRCCICPRIVRAAPLPDSGSSPILWHLACQWQLPDKGHGLIFYPMLQEWDHAFVKFLQAMSFNANIKSGNIERRWCTREFQFYFDFKVPVDRIL